jgi:hypothetical protein
MFCLGCGTALPASAKFCPSCGAPQTGPIPPAEPKLPSGRPSTSSTKPGGTTVNNFTGCIIILIATVVIIFVIAAISSNGSWTPSAVTSTMNTAAPNPETGSDPCPGELMIDLKTASQALDNEDWQKAYRASSKGINYIENSCPSGATNPDVQYVTKGYLLSYKAFAEHHLPQGDSRTDLNEANQLLVECQTEPGIYGTHEAAECESQEQNNITAQTKWDVYGN